MASRSSVSPAAIPCLPRGCSAADVPTSVVYCGTDAAAPTSARAPRPPSPLQAGDDDLILCLGASYHHKNRSSGPCVERAPRRPARPTRPGGSDATRGQLLRMRKPRRCSGTSIWAPRSLRELSPTPRSPGYSPTLPWSSTPRWWKVSVWFPSRRLPSGSRRWPRGLGQPG